MNRDVLVQTNKCNLILNKSTQSAETREIDHTQSILLVTRGARSRPACGHTAKTRETQAISPRESSTRVPPPSQGPKRGCSAAAAYCR